MPRSDLGNFSQGGVIKENFKKSISLLYLLSLLNSKFIRSLYSNSVKERGRAFPQVKLEKLKPLPIKIISLKEQEPFIEIVDKILAISKSDDYSKNTEKQAKVRNYENQIDQMVYELYDLTPEEIEIAENSNKK